MKLLGLLYALLLAYLVVILVDQVNNCRWIDAHLLNGNRVYINLRTAITIEPGGVTTKGVEQYARIWHGDHVTSVLETPRQLRVKCWWNP